jgi:hypothetical protein
MTHSITRAALFLALVGLIAAGGGCVMEERTVDVVVTDETCADFTVNEQAASFVLTAYVDLANTLSEALLDNDASREDIVSARIVSMTYGVTAFDQSHDWMTTGSLTVERYDKTDGPYTILEYTSQSVQEALGKKIPANLNSDGVGVINRALEDYVAGENPTLIFKFNNVSVSPLPSASDPIVFTWQPCLMTQVVVATDTDVPDPF